MSNASERTQVNAYIPPSQKQKWDEWLEDQDKHPSMSQLIRFSVERVIATDGKGGVGQGSVPDELAEKVGEIHEWTHRMEKRMDDVDERLQSVESNVREAPADVQELAGDVFAALPTEDEATWRYDTEGMPGDGDDYQGPDTGRVRDVADHLDAKPYEVRRAIDHLQESSSLVESVVADGEERYYRSG